MWSSWRPFTPPLTQGDSYAVLGEHKWPTSTFVHIEDYATGAVRWSPDMAEAQTQRLLEALGAQCASADAPLDPWINFRPGIAIPPRPQRAPSEPLRPRHASAAGADVSAAAPQPPSSRVLSVSRAPGTGKPLRAQHTGDTAWAMVRFHPQAQEDHFKDLAHSTAFHMCA